MLQLVSMLGCIGKAKIVHLVVQDHAGQHFIKLNLMN
jgi:hypothetical protein